MVNILKARAKAKKSGAPATDVGPPPPAAERGGPRSYTEKLEKFKAEAGQRRQQVTPQPTIDLAELDLLTFAIDGEQYAIDVERVMEISPPRPLTRVPNADPFILGVMSLRGSVVTLVDVRGRLGHRREGPGQQVIVVTDSGGPIGFDVDRVLRPVQLGLEAVEPHPVVHASEERPAIRGVFRQSGALTILLDLEKLLS